MKKMFTYPKFIIFIVVSIAIFVLDSILFKNKYLSTYHYLFLEKGGFQSIIFGATIVLCFFSLGALFFLKNKIIIYFLTSIILLSSAIDLTYQNINGKGFNYNAINEIYMEGSQMKYQAIQTFIFPIFKAFGIITIVLILAIFIRNQITKRNIYLSNKVILVLLFLSITSSYLIQYKTTNYIDEFPSPFKVINTSVYYSIYKTYYGKRRTLQLIPINKSKFNTIIWIIDESVGGQYLSLNGYSKNNTPYLNTLKQGILNLGLASSITNCSATSNISLMGGLQIDELPDRKYKVLKQPSIFEYAQNAGYKTSYISGQSQSTILQNYMTKFDLKYIDDFYQPKEKINVNNQKNPEEDLVAKIKNNLNKNTKNFMFIVKRGAHFYYENDYPQKNKPFKPDLKIGEAMSIQNKKLVLNSYSNAIKWRVDDFFNYLFKQTNLLHREKSIIIYTSDHGQSILENNIIATHCTALNPPKTQGIVPLILFGINVDSLHISNNFKNHSSHFLIFPSTLKLMGFKTTNNTFFDKKPRVPQLFYHNDIFGIVKLRKTNVSNLIRKITSKTKNKFIFK